MGTLARNHVSRNDIAGEKSLDGISHFLHDILPAATCDRRRSPYDIGYRQAPIKSFQREIQGDWINAIFEAAGLAQFRIMQNANLDYAEIDRLVHDHAAANNFLYVIESKIKSHHWDATDILSIRCRGATPHLHPYHRRAWGDPLHLQVLSLAVLGISKSSRSIRLHDLSTWSGPLSMLPLWRKSEA
jgi:hypothetical protein